MILSENQTFDRNSKYKSKYEPSTLWSNSELHRVITITETLTFYLQLDLSVSQWQCSSVSVTITFLDLIQNRYVAAYNHNKFQNVSKIQQQGKVSLF